MYDLKNRSLLCLKDLTNKEIRYLLDLAKELKRKKYARQEEKRLEGKNIVLLFEKSSTRTRCAFEVASVDQGAHVTYIDPIDSHFGEKESVIDTSKVLSRMYDAIVFRGFSQKTIETFSRYSQVPVWNGLTDTHHPTQVLADFLTIEEHLGHLQGIKFAFLGNASSNMARSLLEGCALMGMDCRIISPKQLFPDQQWIEECRIISKVHNGKITITDDIDEGIKDVQIVYTDVWLSIGESQFLWQERINLLNKYQVNESVMNKAAQDALFMHCLPAIHDRNTKIGEKIFDKYNYDNGLEVTNDVFTSAKSIVFDEAENRLHTIKALMVATLGF